MIRREVMILALFAISILLLVSNFGVGGAVGGFISGVMFGLFGMFAYVLPVALFLVTAFSISNRENTIATIKAAAMAVAGVLWCCFLQLLTGQEGGAETARAFYTYSEENKLGGGFLGGMLCKMLKGAFGTAGTWTLLLVLFIICVVVITERSFISGVKRQGRKVYDSAREDAVRRRKRQEERAALRREADAEEEDTEEVKKVSRREKRVSGVALNTTIQEASPAVEMEMDPDLESIREPEVKKPPLKKMKMGEVREITIEEPELLDLDELFNIPIHRGDTEAEAFREERAVYEPERTHTAMPVSGKRASTAENPRSASDAVHAMAAAGYMGSAETAPEPEEIPVSPEAQATRHTGRDMEAAGNSGVDQEREAVPAETGRESAEKETPRPGKLAPAGQSHLGEASYGTQKSGQDFQTGTGRHGGESSGLSQNTYAGVPAEGLRTPPIYELPPIHLLKQVKNKGGNSDRQLQETARNLQQILRDFGVGVTVTDVSCGPSVTRYELQPDQGVKVSRIVALSDDIKLNLAVADIRIEAPIPGKRAVGIEVPNAENTTVSFRELASCPEFKNHKSNIAFAVGKDIGGKIMVADIAKMPHLLIAGATGSGKSVCINTLIMSILYKANPEDVKLIMVDPKVVELSVYNGIPHLLIPVVTDPKKATAALNWAVVEMEKRYRMFAECNVRNLQGYNEKIKGIADIDDDTKPQKLPQIVIIVDELADLMMVASKEVEDAICRLAQLARAAGIHLIIATQRPSVNVITGLIKANMPSRIAFAVSSGVDSRTIIDMNGAEKLLGKGDMLFYPSGLPRPVRVQGAFISDEEVGAVVEFLSQNSGECSYSNEVAEHISNAQIAVEESGTTGNTGGDGRDPLFAEAGRFILEKNKASIGMLQRWFKVGFNRAARIMDQLADAGVVGQDAGTKSREILMTREAFEQYLEENG